MAIKGLGVGAPDFGARASVLFVRSNRVRFESRTVRINKAPVIILGNSLALVVGKAALVDSWLIGNRIV